MTHSSLASSSLTSTHKEQALFDHSACEMIARDSPCLVVMRCGQRGRTTAAADNSRQTAADGSRQTAADSRDSSG
jgi:hypothetical protein